MSRFKINVVSFEVEGEEVYFKELSQKDMSAFNSFQKKVKANDGSEADLFAYIWFLSECDESGKRKFSDEAKGLKEVSEFPLRVLKKGMDNFTKVNNVEIPEEAKEEDEKN